MSTKLTPKNIATADWSVAGPARAQTWRSAMGATWRKIWFYRYIYLLMLPGLLFFLIFKYVPMWGVIIAFQDFRLWQGIFNSPWVGFEHFQVFFNSPYFFRLFRNTLIISGLNLLLVFPAPILLALLLNEVRHGAYKRVVQTISYLPHFISWVVVGGMLIYMFSINVGFFPKLITRLGGEPIQILGNADAFLALVVGDQYAFSPDSHWLVTVDANDFPHLWDLTRPDPTSEPLVLSGHDERQPIIAAVIFSPDNRWLITTGYDKTVRLWDLAVSPPASTLYVLEDHELPVTAIAVTPDGHHLATAGGDRYVLLWDLEGDLPSPNSRMLSPLPYSVSRLTTSPDSHWLIAASGNAVYLWDLTDSSPASTMVQMVGHDSAVSSVHVSHDSRWLATVGVDGTARLWSLTNPQPRAAPMLLHRYWGGISAMAASPDSQWLVTRSLDGRAHLWRFAPMADPTLVGALSAQVNNIRADGRWLITGSDDGGVRLWPLHSQELLQRACRTVGRNLTQDEWQQYLGDEPYRTTCSNRLTVSR